MAPGMPAPCGQAGPELCHRLAPLARRLRILPGDALPSDYLRKGLPELHHQLPYASFFVFSFLTLDETCRRTTSLVFRDQKTRTRQKRSLGSSRPDQCGDSPASLTCRDPGIFWESGLLALLWRSYGHLPTRFSYFGGKLEIPLLLGSSLQQTWQQRNRHSAGRETGTHDSCPPPLGMAALRNANLSSLICCFHRNVCKCLDSLLKTPTQKSSSFLEALLPLLGELRPRDFAEKARLSPGLSPREWEREGGWGSNGAVARVFLPIPISRSF